MNTCSRALLVSLTCVVLYFERFKWERLHLRIGGKTVNLHVMLTCVKSLVKEGKVQHYSQNDR